MEQDSFAMASAPGGDLFPSPEAYRVYEMNRPLLDGILRQAPREFTPAAEAVRTILTLPMPDGGYLSFRIQESSILSPGLAARHPDMKTYLGHGIDDPTSTVRFDVSHLGMNVMILSPDGIYFVKPFSRGDTRTYISYAMADAESQGFECLVTELAGNLPLDPPVSALAPTGPTLHTYRCAVLATGEYTDYFSGDVADAEAQIISTINFVNGIYEVEASIRLNLVVATAYPDSSTDPFTQSPTLTEIQDVFNTEVTDANYDIGHLFNIGGSGGSGLATIGTVCVDGSKARAWSRGVPDNMIYPWVVSHEMGHSFSALHTFNDTTGARRGNRTASHAYEPGGGSTIMSYTARCDQVEARNGFYFHNISFNAITGHRDGTGACSSDTPTGNNPPWVDAGLDTWIPTGTPFRLTAQGGDVDGDVITYCWEQFDLGPPSPPLDLVDGPLFRSRQPITSPTRTFPLMADLVVGNTPHETLPTEPRTLTFRCTVRDNKPNGGGVSYDEMQIIVDGDPFMVTYPNGGETLSARSSVTVEWDVGGGNTPLVNILYSPDRGVTWILLEEGRPNDGSESVTLPCGSTTQARIMVEAVGNVFFDISDDDFTVTEPDIIVESSLSKSYDPDNPWTDDGVAIKTFRIEPDVDLFNVSFVADALQSSDLDCESTDTGERIAADWIEFIPPEIGFVAADDEVTIEVKVTVPVGQQAGDYSGDLYVLAEHECPRLTAVTGDVPFTLTVNASQDIDVDDNHGSVSGNVLHFLGAKGDAVSGTFTVVNPNSDDKNVDKDDGPGNVRMDPDGVVVSDLVKVGDPAVIVPSGDITVEPLVSLASGDAQEVAVSFTVPTDSPVNASYVGTVTVTYEDCFNNNSSDTFGIQLDVDPTQGPLEFVETGLIDSLYYCPPDPWTMVEWVEFDFQVTATGDHRNVRIASGGLRHETFDTKLDDFNFFPNEIAFLASGETRDFAVVVKIPIGSPAGLYSGSFQVVSENGGEHSVPVEVEICPTVDLDIKDSYGSLSANVMEIHSLTRPNSSGGEWTLRGFDIGLPADWINNHDEFDGPGNAPIDCITCEFGDWSPLWIEDVQHPMLHSNFSFTGTGSITGDLCDWESGEFRRTWVSVMVPKMQGTKNHPGTYKGRLDCWAVAAGDTVGHDFFEIETKLAQIVGPGNYGDVIGVGKFGGIPEMHTATVYWGDFASMGLTGGINLYRQDPVSGEFVKLNDAPLPQQSSYEDQDIDPELVYVYRLGVLHEGRELMLGPLSLGATPRVPALSQNFPNPFRQSTQINYELPVNGKVSIRIFDLSGRLVRTLKDVAEPAGYYNVAWNRRDDTGRMVPSGIYYYRITMPDYTATKKMLLIP